MYTAGLWLTDLWAPAFALFLLSFPTGRLTSRVDLAIVGIFVFVTVPLEFLWFLFLVLDNGLNALGIAPNESAAHVIDTIQRYLISLGSVLLVIALGRRWLRSSGPVRRQMTPVLVGALAILLQSASWIFLSSGTRLERLDNLIFLAQIAIPIAVLFVMLQSPMARATSRTSSSNWGRPQRRPGSATPWPTPLATPRCRSPTGTHLSIGSSMLQA